MKNTITTWVLVALLIVGAVFVYKYTSRVETPVVGADGSFSGSYSIEGILTLQKPYKCTFEKEDEASKISATVYTNLNDVYADFTIQTSSVDNQRFNSFFLIQNNTTYTWTSFTNLGYKTKVVKSASINASPAEQAQLIGIKDKLSYECKPVVEADPSLFTVPTSITFTDLTK